MRFEKYLKEDIKKGSKIYFKQYKKGRGAIRHQFDLFPGILIEIVKKGYRTISGQHPNYIYHYADLYKVKKIGKSGKPIGKYIEVTELYDENEKRIDSNRLTKE